MTSIFDGIEKAATTRSGNWVRPGTYHAQINGVRLTQKFTGERFVAVEMKVVGVVDDDNGQGHRIGEEVVHLMKVSSPNFLGNFKQFACSTLGCTEAELGQVEADRITSDEQPLAGIVVEFNAVLTDTRQGNKFTKVIYRGEIAAVEDKGDEADSGEAA
ncbi:MAG: hypothetical protein AAF628_22545 [Planctomycetota bacterium]